MRQLIAQSRARVARAPDGEKNETRRRFPCDF